MEHIGKDTVQGTDRKPHSEDSRARVTAQHAFSWHLKKNEALFTGMVRVMLRGKFTVLKSLVKTKLFLTCKP